MSAVDKHKQTNLVQTVPRRSIQPILHPDEDILVAIQGTDLRADAIVQSLAFHAVEENWESLWAIADSLKREVSVLFDNQGLIWVDIGTPGMVRLSPPIGSQIPFQLWIHTHPWDAYWSITDKSTLSRASGVLNRALVLGHDHLVQTVYHETVSESSQTGWIFIDGVLSNWTAEAAVSYATLRQK